MLELGMAATLEIGNRIAPWRFLAMIGIAAVAVPLAWSWIGWQRGIMLGFDAAAAAFILLCIPLLRHPAGSIRLAATRNDANRAVLLAITGVVSLVVLIVVAIELGTRDAASATAILLVIVTLAMTWLFSNLVFALHYAHLFYTAGGDGKDLRGLTFPATSEPDYWEFVYFAFTLGMTFQTSDVAITRADLRKVALFHSLLAFVFNIGVLALTINVLGGG